MKNCAVNRCRHIAMALMTYPTAVDVNAGPGRFSWNSDLWGSRVKGNWLSALFATDSYKEFTKLYNKYASVYIQVCLLQH